MGIELEQSKQSRAKKRKNTKIPNPKGKQRGEKKKKKKKEPRARTTNVAVSDSAWGNGNQCALCFLVFLGFCFFAVAVFCTLSVKMSIYMYVSHNSQSVSIGRLVGRTSKDFRDERAYQPYIHTSKEEKVKSKNEKLQPRPHRYLSRG